MVLPVSLLLCLAVALLPAPSLADSPSCVFNAADTGLANSYDLSSLTGEQLIEHPVKTPPTNTSNRVRFILCGEEAGLGKEEGVDDEDQCPPNTVACYQLQNTSPKSTPPLRTISAIPIAISSSEVEKKEVSVKCSEGSPKTQKCFDLVLNMGGGTYNDQPQSLSITLVCTSEPSNPSFVSYASNLLSLRWETPKACPRSDDGRGPPSPAGDRKKHGLGFFGWLFLLMLLGPPIYLGLGIYHNRTTYDARGWDAIPHREFWRDFPSLVHDLASHLIGGISGARRSGGGGGATSTGRGGYESL